MKIISKKLNKKNKICSLSQFNSFINREPHKEELSSLEVTTSAHINKMGNSAIVDFRNLIELAKSASKNQDIPMADLFYELKELKEKEVGIIHNYLAKQK